ncbi:CGNR zinc finger domain-containing protein [Streptomyces sp. NPDC093099]|uniref:CGNR zinc finger domain-containing protein n=1 Tax=Streptomyces sp. NPDC093099 TaxID=3366028 RepID=UPI00381CE615
MSWVASERYRVRQAPAGLALVQELINTRAISDYAPDLLADRESAERWLTGAAGEWARIHGLGSPDCTLSPSDPRALRDLRDSFERLLTTTPPASDTDPAAGETPRPAPAPVRGGGPVRGVTVRLAPDEQGQVQLLPVGRGRDWLESALWSETLLAQRAGTWARLKICRNGECGSSFYDTSRNNSGVWHDVRICGNAVNLRASRQRKRIRAAAESDSKHKDEAAAKGKGKGKGAPTG